MSSSKAVRSKQTDRPESPATSPIWQSGAALIGEVSRILSDGTLLVDFPANALGPLEARTIVEDLYTGAPVLLAFEQGDPTRPIVLGLVKNRIRTAGSELRLAAGRVLIEAHEAISIQCGEARIEASKDGKLKLGGKDVVSRASRTNKVQGSTVKLN